MTYYAVTTRRRQHRLSRWPTDTTYANTDGTGARTTTLHLHASPPAPRR